jgi:hypothetical protein
MQRLIVVGLISLGLAFGMTACGSSTSTKATETTIKPSAPTLVRGADGHYSARVNNKSEARETCNMQSELGAQLKTLGASSSVELVVLHYGPGKPIIPSDQSYAFVAGDFFVVSKNATLCGVAVSK